MYVRIGTRSHNEIKSIAINVAFSRNHFVGRDYPCKSGRWKRKKKRLLVIEFGDG